MSILDRIKGVIKRDDEPEISDELAQLINTVKINEQDRTFYAVPGTTHPFMGEGNNCTECGWARGKTHDFYNQIEQPKPKLVPPPPDPAIVGTLGGRKKRRIAEKKAEVYQTYIDAIMRAYENGHISQHDAQVLLENPDVGIKHMLKGY